MSDFRPGYAAVGLFNNVACAALIFGATKIQRTAIRIPAVIAALGTAGYVSAMKFQPNAEFDRSRKKEIASYTIKHTLDLAFYALAAKGLQRWANAGIAMRIGIALGTTFAVLWAAARLSDSSTILGHLLINRQRYEYIPDIGIEGLINIVIGGE